MQINLSNFNAFNRNFQQNVVPQSEYAMAMQTQRVHPYFYSSYFNTCICIDANIHKKTYSTYEIRKRRFLSISSSLLLPSKC